MTTPRQTIASLSVIIPAYNAGRDLAGTLRDVLDWLNGAGIRYEVIVVDDGSRDDTAAIATRFAPNVRLLRNDQNRGKGFSVRRGVLEATLDWVLFMDADNATRIHHIDRFAEHALSADILIASRRVAGARIVRAQPWLRQFLGRTFPHLVRMLALPDLRDTQCGFKLFRATAARRIFPLVRVERFAFDVEVLLLARRMGLRIAEIPVDWQNPGWSTLALRTDTWCMFRDLIAVSWRLRKGASMTQSLSADPASKNQP